MDDKARPPDLTKTLSHESNIRQTIYLSIYVAGLKLFFLNPF